jgi:hypothetical protein
VKPEELVSHPAAGVRCRGWAATAFRPNHQAPQKSVKKDWTKRPPILKLFKLLNKKSGMLQIEQKRRSL